MKIAPIQMVDLRFRRFSVEVDFELHPDAPEASDPHSLLEGVALLTEVTYTAMDQEDPRGIPYFVTLRLQIKNEASEGEPDQKFSPYRMDVDAAAIVVVARSMAQRAVDLVAVNGPALIWSAIREHVAMLTSRMPAGTALLPSVNFIDLKRGDSAPAPTDQPASTTKPRATKRSRAQKP